MTRHVPRPRPGWVADPDFDVRHHVRVLSVAHPGGPRQVLDLVALVEASPFEPVRSPWDLTVMDGLEHGRAALYLRADHVLTDGVGGTGLVKLLLDRVTPGVDDATTSTMRPAATIRLAVWNRAGGRWTLRRSSASAGPARSR